MDKPKTVEVCVCHYVSCLTRVSGCVCLCVSSSKDNGRLCSRQRYVVGGERTDISAGTSHFPNVRILCLSL